MHALAALEAHALVYGGSEIPASSDAPMPQEVTTARRAWVAVERGDAAATDSAEFALEALRGEVLLNRAWENPGYHQCVGVLLITERFAAARVAIDRLSEKALRRGSIPMQIAAAWYRAELELRTGALSEAERWARSALELDAEAGAFSTGAMRVLVYSLAERGAFDAAHEVLRTHGFGGEVGHGPGVTGVLEARALLRLASGDFARAQSDARAVGTRRIAQGRTGPGWGSWSSIEALALAHQGRLEEGAALADAELRLAREFGAAGPIARASIARAVAEPDNRKRADICEHALVEVPGAPRVELARLRIELGTALSRLGRRIDARSALRPALAEADAAGAVLLAERARRELVVTGLRPRRAALEGVGALTPRQHEICGLAAAGKGNRAIAGQLFLSIKTVETHLAAAYSKLGVAGRAQLAAALAS
jgi:DNA-binding CsgD family transcriptional regulator